MPNSVFYKLCNSLEDVTFNLQTAFDTWVTGQALLSAMHLELEDAHGFRGIKITYEYQESEDGNELYLLWTRLGAGEKMPARNLMMDPGWAPQWVTMFADDAAAFLSWEQTRDFWFGTMMQLKGSIIDEWTTGQSLNLLQNSITLLNKTNGTAVCSYHVATDAEVLAATEQMFAFNAVVTVPNVHAGHPPDIQNPSGAVSLITSGSASLKIMADALEAISEQDISVAINHGQAIYSVRSKVTTGT